MPNTEVQCPNCGSFATLPKPGDARRLLEEMVHGRLAFDNPKWVQAFRARKITAVCDTCKYEFDADTPARACNSGAANVATEKRTLAERLKDLVELRAAGLITEDEFRQKRKDILRGLQ